MIYLDTHVVVWLYAGEHSRFARTARQLIETEPLLISPVLLLELALLEETGRIRARAQRIFTELQESVALSICDLPLRRSPSPLCSKSGPETHSIDSLWLKRMHGAPD